MPAFFFLRPFLAMMLAGETRPPSASQWLQAASPQQSSTDQAKDTPARTSSASTPPEVALQQAIQSSGSDRAALVRNLEAFLAQYPDYSNRTQIYRALVEACLHLQDRSRATEYAERMVALNPSDTSILVLAIQLLEQQENEAALRRAISYSTTLIEAVNRASVDGRSPRVSAEQWNLGKKGDQANSYFVRGDLYMKLKDYAAARKDMQLSYETVPTAGAAERQGEIAELQKDFKTATEQYGRAFALAEGKSGNMSRPEIRKKVGNVWRLAHGSEDGLGEYLVHAFDDATRTAAKPGLVKNEGAHRFSEFKVRKAPDGSSYPLEGTKGKVVVVNFWATWCGPCHALEPRFARVAKNFQSIPGTLFLSVNCDEDEALVGPYLLADKVSTDVVFADGLERLFSVDSFPTVIVLDRDGKTTYRTEGFDPDMFEPELSGAIFKALGAPAALHASP
jgi:thiol-disulfide isomerase/thioredoxin